MAVDVELREGILMLVCRETLTAGDLQVTADVALQMEEEMTVAPVRLTDLSAVTQMDIGFEEIMALVHRRRASPLANNVRSAIVVCNEAQRGMARMFQTLNDHPRITIRIFDDREQALDWLRGS